MADFRIKEIAATAVAPAADDFLELDGVTNASRKITPGAAVAQFRNGLAPRGGLAFDGTTNCRAVVTLTGQVVGADDISLSVVFRVSLTNSEQWAIAVGPTTGDLVGGAGGMGLTITAAGHLQAGVQCTAGYEFRRISNFVSAYAGKVVHVVAVRTGATLALYVNGALQTTVAGDTSGAYLASSITSTLLAVNFRGTNYGLGGSLTVYFPVAYNLALSAADALEICELGGAVPERFKFGSTPNRYPIGNALSFGAGDANADTAGNTNGTTWTKTAGARTGGAGAYYNKITGSGWAGWYHWSLGLSALSQTYLVRFWARLNTGTTGGGLLASLAPQGGSSIGVSARQPVTSSWAQYSHVVYAPIAKTTGLGMLSFDTQFVGAPGWDLDIDDVEVINLGAICALPLDDGLGFQLQDVSSNRLHALMTTTGVSHVAPLYGPARVRAVTDGTTTAQKLCGGTTLPAQCQILRIRARAQAGTPNLILGSSSGGTQIVASVAPLDDLERPHDRAHRRRRLRRHRSMGDDLRRQRRRARSHVGAAQSLIPCPPIPPSSRPSSRPTPCLVWAPSPPTMATPTS